MQTTILIIGFALLIIVNTAVVWFVMRRKGEGSDDKSLLMLQNQLENLHKIMDEKMGESRKELSEKIENHQTKSQKLIIDITKKLTEVQETNKQVFSFTESLANLEKVLKHQKQRGNLGERGLEMILENILPPGQYEMQYQFPDGSVVDAVIKAKEGLIPVDAKFSLDNYQRLVNEEDEEKKEKLQREFKNDLKKRINETAKYIKPSEGTLPFAMMYIPAEGIFYDLLVNPVGTGVNSRSLTDYAYMDKKVIIVSPTTFVAYLHTILQGFKAFQIEERAKDIEKNVKKLGRHISAFDDYHERLGKSLSTTVNHYNRSRKELNKIDKDVYRITGEGADIEVDLLDKPAQE